MAGGKRKSVKGTSKTTKGNSEYKALDHAITKATNPKQNLPKEKHVKTIFDALSPSSSPRSDIIYCIYSLAMRLSQTHNWTVALKTLFIIHRAMRELDDAVWEEFISYSREREHMLNLLHFQDASTANALDYSAWVRGYGLYLDERLRCFAMFKYDVVTCIRSKEKKFNTQDLLLEQLPSIQELQSRILECKPKGAALYHPLLQYALSVVGGESLRLYAVITHKVVILLDKYLEMSPEDGAKALEIYKRSGIQAERLAVFFESCRGVEHGRGKRSNNNSNKDDESPADSSLPTLEDFLKEAPRILMPEDQQKMNNEEGGGNNAKENMNGGGSEGADDNNYCVIGKQEIRDVPTPPVGVAAPQLVNPLLVAFLLIEILIISFIGRMTGGIRKIRGNFKLAKASSEYKALDHAITKATNHKRLLPKEKHVRTIFFTLSPSTPRVDVVYCLSSLSSRLGQTRNWKVALKTLIIIHRAMRELDHTVWEEFINYSREREHMLNVIHFQDTSSPNALDYSAWIRNYALYLDERLRCYVMLNYDAVTYAKELKLETQDLLHQLPFIQELQFRLLQCKPRGAALYNPLIQYSLSIVASESVKLHVAITVRIVSLLDKFFEMNRSDAIKALDIYKKSGMQAQCLAAFFDTCRGMEFGRGQKFVNIKEHSDSFMTTLEDYIKDAPATSTLDHKVIVDKRGATAKDNSVADGDLKDEPRNEVAAAPQVADLLGLDDLLTGASEFEQNSYSLPSENSSNVGSPATGWEYVLFAELSCNEDGDEEMKRSGDQESVEGGGEITERTGQNIGYPYPPAPTTDAQCNSYPPHSVEPQQDIPFEFPILINQKSINPFE
ncbi:putative clathrin assembly protein [Senna tora]|uniref:Putative clathrin assembly protein n=1 Tax=Senna tora TaxID=362788 RepID=A0A834X4Y5_9FABA|nr:putative clathrin assembly protein [Senna tora]